MPTADLCHSAALLTHQLEAELVVQKDINQRLSSAYQQLLEERSVDGSTAESQASDAAAELQRARDEIAALRQQAARADRDARASKESLRQAQTDIASLNARLLDATRDIAGLQRQNQQLTQRLQTASVSDVDLHERLRQADERVAAMRQHEDAAQQRAAHAVAQLQAAQQDAMQLELANRQLSARAQGAGGDVAEVERQLREALGEMEHLRSELQRSEQERQVLGEWQREALARQQRAEAGLQNVGDAMRGSQQIIAHDDGEAVVGPADGAAQGIHFAEADISTRTGEPVARTDAGGELLRQRHGSGGNAAWSHADSTELHAGEGIDAASQDLHSTHVGAAAPLLSINPPPDIDRMHSADGTAEATTAAPPPSPSRPLRGLTSGGRKGITRTTAPLAIAAVADDTAAAAAPAEPTSPVTPHNAQAPTGLPSTPPDIPAPTRSAPTPPPSGSAYLERTGAHTAAAVVAAFGWQLLPTDTPDIPAGPPMPCWGLPTDPNERSDSADPSPRRHLPPPIHPTHGDAPGDAPTKPPPTPPARRGTALNVTSASPRALSGKTLCLPVQRVPGEGGVQTQPPPTPRQRADGDGATPQCVPSGIGNIFLAADDGGEGEVIVPPVPPQQPARRVRKAQGSPRAGGQQSPARSASSVRINRGLDPPSPAPWRVASNGTPEEAGGERDPSLLTFAAAPPSAVPAPGEAPQPHDVLAGLVKEKIRQLRTELRKDAPRSIA